MTEADKIKQLSADMGEAMGDTFHAVTRVYTKGEFFCAQIITERHTEHCHKPEHTEIIECALKLAQAALADMEAGWVPKSVIDDMSVAQKVRYRAALDHGQKSRVQKILEEIEL